MMNLFMLERKGQSQIITTVLIILLVLAAVIIVWQVVNPFVESGSESIKNAEQCFNINLKITNVDDAVNTVTVYRGPGNGDLRRVAVVVNGNRVDSNTADDSDLVELSSKVISVTAINSGDVVEVYAVVGENYNLCDAAEDRFTA